MTNPEPHPDQAAAPHAAAPPPAPGLGGPGYSVAGVYQPIADPGRPTSTKRRLGLVALILGVAGLIVELAFVFGQIGAISARAISVIGAIALAQNVIVGIVGIGAIVCGALALVRRNEPRGMAGVGLGIGIALVSSILITVVYSALIAVVTG